jgi:hypothetical protein
MSRRIATKSLAAAAILGLFAAHPATAQQTQNLNCTTHFVYFATGSHALTPEDQDHIRDVAAMMQSTPTFVATIVGKTDSAGSADFNEHLSQRRAESVFEALVYANKVPENRVQLRWTGERLPFMSTADEEAESHNRLAAIIVSDTGSARCGGTAVEAGAKAMLKAMTEYVTAQKAISFDYDVSLEVVTGEDQKLTLAASGNVELARPDKVRASRSGGFADIETVFDGKTLTILGKNLKMYTQIAIPGSIDHLVDELREKYHRPLPAADLLISNSYDELMDDVVDVKDLGSGVIGGTECDHLALRKKEVDWQIWIAQGSRPYPCRYDIATKTVAGSPGYSIQIRDWKAGSEVASGGFSFTPPADVRQVDVADLAKLKDMSDLPSNFRIGGK